MAVKKAKAAAKAPSKSVARRTAAQKKAEEVQNTSAPQGAVQDALNAPQGVTKGIPANAKMLENGTYEVNGTVYNRYGVCMSCNGGNPDCGHNNLEQTNQGIVCKTCGAVVG